MSVGKVWDTSEIVALLKRRTLDQLSPASVAYFYPGAQVLDVGCGPGTVTVDIARRIQPGKVAGVDSAQSSIDAGTHLTKTLELENVTFHAGNTYSLDFADESFDITCSFNLFAHLTEPVRALREQKRVTRRGGRVIASTGDYGGKILFPACPAVERLIAALFHLSSDPADEETFMNLYFGRASRALFAEAGFTEVDVKVEVAPRSVAVPGSNEWNDHYEIFQILTDQSGPFEAKLQKLMRDGHLDEGTLQAARQEIEAASTHPHALYVDEMRFVTVGTVA